MDFLFNELSFHGQFHSLTEFHGAVERVMQIRSDIKRFGSELFCHRNIATTSVAPDISMSQAIQGLSVDKQRAWIQWLTRQGPYWDDERQHDSNQWLECNADEIVTDTAIGEAAFSRIHGMLRETVSVEPSNWLRNPILVTWRKADTAQHQSVEVPNHWSTETVSRRLESSLPSADSWQSLERQVRVACERLVITEDAFHSLRGHPFVSGAADGIQIRLHLLNKLKGCFDDHRKRSDEGDRIIGEHFSGAKAWFTDSSEKEKANFKSDLTFRHPESPGQYLFCPWHGKVKWPQIRIHFSWPISANLPLYIVYVGPKITKR